MKGKKITNSDPLSGGLNALDMIVKSFSGDVSGRDSALTDELEDITVDTCLPFDTDIWETGVLRESIEGKWVIVSQYENAQEAQKGHTGWVTLLTKNPKAKIKDIDMWNIGR